jgi:hypothetical protein
MITGPQEGEFFVDEAAKPIPNKSQWEELTTNQLIDVQLQLEDKLWSFARNPVIAKTIQEGLTELRALIASRSS